MAYTIVMFTDLHMSNYAQVVTRCLITAALLGGVVVLATICNLQQHAVTWSDLKLPGFVETRLKVFDFLGI